MSKVPNVLCALDVVAYTVRQIGSCTVKALKVDGKLALCCQVTCHVLFSTMCQNRYEEEIKQRMATENDFVLLKKVRHSTCCRGNGWLDMPSKDPSVDPV